VADHETSLSTPNLRFSDLSIRDFSPCSEHAGESTNVFTNLIYKSRYCPNLKLGQHPNP
jgi:hypothetical protein